MKGTKIVIDTEGRMLTKHLDRAVTLEELQQNVGGYIEPVPGFNKYKGKTAVAFCNEEGKLKKLDINAAATALWAEAAKVGRPGNVPWGDVLVGPVVILTGDEEFVEAV